MFVRIYLYFINTYIPTRHVLSINSRCKYTGTIQCIGYTPIQYYIYTIGFTTFIYYYLLPILEYSTYRYFNLYLYY